MRLFSARSTRQRTAEQVIEAEIARDPAPEGASEGARCYVVATPLAGPPELLTAHLATDELTPIVHKAFADATPGWRSALYGNEPRATGRGWHSYEITARRINPSRRSHNGGTRLDVELSDDGSMALFATGFVTVRNFDSGHLFWCGTMT